MLFVVELMKKHYPMKLKRTFLKSYLMKKFYVPVSKLYRNVFKFFSMILLRRTFQTLSNNKNAKDKKHKKLSKRLEKFNLILLKFYLRFKMSYKNKMKELSLRFINIQWSSEKRLIKLRKNLLITIS